MNCAWQAYLNILPLWMRDAVDKQGGHHLQELRLRYGQPPELIFHDKSNWLPRSIEKQDLDYVINAASKYSPWNTATIEQGYITAPGGHRIGICGEAVMENQHMRGIRSVSSLCIRVARDFPGIAAHALQYTGSVLIIGKPGSGKTTLLRDLIRQRSQQGRECIAVVDERGELFPMAQGQAVFQPGKRTDILTGCKKAQGIDALLRTMCPACIAVDEITAEEDCSALIRSAWSGVCLLATAHASSKRDLFSRPVYRSIIENKIFDTLLVMQPDKTWLAERISV